MNSSKKLVFEMSAATDNQPPSPRFGQDIEAHDKNNLNSLKNLFKKLMDAQVENYRKVADEIVGIMKFKRNVRIEHSQMGGPDDAAEQQEDACPVAPYLSDDRRPVEAAM